MSSKILNHRIFLDKLRITLLLFLSQFSLVQNTCYPSQSTYFQLFYNSIMKCWSHVLIHFKGPADYNIPVSTVDLLIYLVENCYHHPVSIQRSNSKGIPSPLLVQTLYRTEYCIDSGYNFIYFYLICRYQLVSHVFLFEIFYLIN